MKKLMLIAAVAFCGAAFAEGEITSNNIVGYMNNGKTVMGLNLVGPGFQDINFTSIKLNSLKVTNKFGEEVGTGNCFINLVDSEGETLKTYNWESTGRGSSKTWGWMEGLVKVPDTVVLGRGVGVLFTAENEGDVLVSAGEVDLEGIAFGDTVVGLNVIANPYPTIVKINELKVINASDEEVGTGNCFINLVDSEGETLKTYNWESTGRGSSKSWGWNEGLVPVDDTVVIGAGEAVLFTAENVGDKLVFPSKK